MGADGGGGAINFACGLTQEATCLARVVVVVAVPVLRGVTGTGGSMKEDVCDGCWLIHLWASPTTLPSPAPVPPPALILSTTSPLPLLTFTPSHPLAPASTTSVAPTLSSTPRYQNLCRPTLQLLPPITTIAILRSPPRRPPPPLAST